MSKRIYIVEVADVDRSRKSHLVEASSAAQAIRKIASPMFQARVALQRELVELVQAGVKVQEA